MGFGACLLNYATNAVVAEPEGSTPLILPAFDMTLSRFRPLPSSHPISLRSVLMFSFHLFDVPSCRFLRSFPHQNYVYISFLFIQPLVTSYRNSTRWPVCHYYVRFFIPRSFKGGFPNCVAYSFVVRTIDNDFGTIGKEALRFSITGVTEENNEKLRKYGRFLCREAF
jgi:hypothetical protein